MENNLNPNETFQQYIERVAQDYSDQFGINYEDALREGTAGITKAHELFGNKPASVLKEYSILWINMMIINFFVSKKFPHLTESIMDSLSKKDSESYLEFFFLNQLLAHTLMEQRIGNESVISEMILGPAINGTFSLEKYREDAPDFLKDTPLFKNMLLPLV